MSLLKRKFSLFSASISPFLIGKSSRSLSSPFQKMASSNFTAKGAFNGRTVLVTGGGGAIGKAVSLAFASAGANVVVNDLPSRDSESDGPAERVVKEIKSLGASAIAVTDSVLDGESLVAAALKTYGRLDVIVGCAGAEKTKSFEEHTLEDFRQIIDINTLGTVSPILAAWPTFKKQKFGRVINIVSDTIFGTAHLTSYIAGKGGVFTSTRALAVEGAEHGILVNSVAPIAASPMAFKHIEGLDPETKEAYTKYLTAKFPPESNLPMILALAHESSTTTGESFSIGAWSVSRIVLGFQDGIINAHTMEDCLLRKEEILGSPGKEVKVPSSMEEHSKMGLRGKD
jgi:NAD(P)-dependent dehydrogenase (short-subunit alcohol dehydrogenase family)